MIISSDMKREIILTREIQDKSCQKEKELQPDNTKLLWSLAILVPEDLKGRHLYSTQKYSEIFVQLANVASFWLKDLKVFPEQFQII